MKWKNLWIFFSTGKYQFWNLKLLLHTHMELINNLTKPGIIKNNNHYWTKLKMIFNVRMNGKKRISIFFWLRNIIFHGKFSLLTISITWLISNEKIFNFVFSKLTSFAGQVKKAAVVDINDRKSINFTPK